MNEKPGTTQGINWRFFFLSGILLIVPTWLIAYRALDGGWGYISPLNLPPDDSAQGAGVDRLIYLVHYLMAALFVGWIGYFFYVLFRFHKNRNPKADYYGVQHQGSTWLSPRHPFDAGPLLVLCHRRTCCSQANAGTALRNLFPFRANCGRTRYSRATACVDL